jgi:hypothetical protein
MSKREAFAALWPWRRCYVPQVCDLNAFPMLALLTLCPWIRYPDLTQHLIGDLITSVDLDKS